MLVRNLQGSQKWLPGSVFKVRGPLTFDIQLEDGRIVRKHVDHVISRSKLQGSQCTPVSTETTLEQSQANDDIVPITTPQDELVELISEISPDPSRSNDDEQLFFFLTHGFTETLDERYIFPCIKSHRKGIQTTIFPSCKSKWEGKVRRWPFV